MDYSQGDVIHRAGSRYGRCWFEIEAYKDLVVRSKWGPGNVRAARDALAALDKVLELGGAGSQIKLLGDISDVGFAGPQVQLMMGHWFLKHRHRVAKIAVVGGGRIQGLIVAAIMWIAGFERIRYFLDEADAVRWLRIGGFLSAPAGT